MKDKYITGIHALNVPCNLNTFGDWHRDTINWDKPYMLSYNDTPFGMYGIEFNKHIPKHKSKYDVANHIRALLDMIYTLDFTHAQGMKNDFIVINEYDEEIFDKVFSLNNNINWSKIDKFMENEYKLLWISYKKRKAENK